MTNREKLNAMSNEELARYFAERCTCDFCVFRNQKCADCECQEGIQTWLESEAKE